MEISPSSCRGVNLHSSLHGNVPHEYGERLNMMSNGKHGQPQDGGSLPRPPPTNCICQVQRFVTTYEQRKAYGIRPTICTNQGPTTSMYYMDPDGNRLEAQVDNFDSNEEATAFVKSASFRENPVGVDFDPEDLAHRVRSGEDEASIKKRVDIGPREMPTMVPTAA